MQASRYSQALLHGCTVWQTDRQHLYPSVRQSVRPFAAASSSLTTRLISTLNSDSGWCWRAVAESQSVVPIESIS